MKRAPKEYVTVGPLKKTSTTAIWPDLKRKRPPRATFVENDTETLALMDSSWPLWGTGQPQLHAHHALGHPIRMTPARLRWAIARATYLLRKMEGAK